MKTKAFALSSSSDSCVRGNQALYLRLLLFVVSPQLASDDVFDVDQFSSGLCSSEPTSVIITATRWKKKKTLIEAVFGHFSSSRSKWDMPDVN